MPEDVFPRLDSPTPPRDPAEESWGVESLIGSRVLLGAGLISLLAGAAFFIKLANDHHWIAPEVRVVCGLLAGLLLMLGGAWRLRVARTLVAEGLTGLGASVLYVSLWGAFGPFHLLDYRIAFAAMIAVSAALALIAWSRRSQNVALCGLIGGAVTPMLLVAGPFDHVALAAYLAVLCGVMLALSVRCGYRFVEAASFVAALLYAPAFAPSHVAGDVWTSTQSLTVASVLFAEFALALFVAARRHARIDDYRIALLAVEVLAYGLILELELRWNPHALALADAALAAVLLAAVAVRVPAALRMTYAWLGLGVLTRAVEAWGGGHALTAGIAVEGAALVYLGIHRERTWMRTGGFVLLALASLGATLHLAADRETYAVINERTFTVTAVVLALVAALRELRASVAGLLPYERDLHSVVTIVATLLAFGALSTDAVTATADAGSWTTTTQTTLSALWSVMATALIVLGFRFRSSLARWLGIGLFTLTIVKVFIVDLSGVDVSGRVISALVLGTVLVVVAALYQNAMQRGRRAS